MFLGILQFIVFSNCQKNDTCRIEFSVNDQSVIDFSDTVLINKSKTINLFLLNDQLFLDNKVIFTFKDAENYEEILFVNLGQQYYVYIYPRYKGQIGPYTDTFKNGVLIDVSSTDIKIFQHLEYFEKVDVCDNIKKTVSKMQ
ncbi:hypothetical protein EON78_02630 [bacterium]|nr:MAG: hypothetical protein EON78_02630 [bacterium]